MRRRYELQLAPGAAAQIAEMARASEDGLETGGALFGHTAAAGRVEVVEATEPGPAAIRRANRFQRDLSFTHHRAIDIYEQSRSEWVGEWHTHPTGHLVPSEIDLATYQRHLADPELRFDVFVSIIIGPGRDWSDGIAWMVTLSAALGHPILLGSTEHQSPNHEPKSGETEEQS